MSKADDTLVKLVDEWAEFMLHGKSPDGAVAIGNAKQALYTDLLELIGEDISLPQNKLMETEDIPKFYANKLRQELRDKLKEYFGITE